MTTETVLEIGKETTMTVLLLSSPMLIIAMVVGIFVTMFQTVTSIRDQSLTFIPKIVSIIFALIFFLPWMINVILTFTIKIFTMTQTIT